MPLPERTSVVPPAGPLGPRHQLVSRLAVVAVQGEQLQALCDELQPVLAALARHPELHSTATGLAAVLTKVNGVARDIAVTTDLLGRQVEEAARPLVSPAPAAPAAHAAPAVPQSGDGQRPGPG